MSGGEQGGATMVRILVIGYGNPSRMDDGVGHFVVNQLNRRWGLPQIDLLGEPRGDGSDTAVLGDRVVRTLWLQQLDVGLAEELAEVDRVILVDAHVGGEAVVEAEVVGDHHVGVTSHVATPETLLAIAEAAYGRRPRATRYSVRGERFDFAAELTAPVKTAAEELARRLEQEIGGCMS